MLGFQPLSAAPISALAAGDPVGTVNLAANPATTAVISAYPTSAITLAATASSTPLLSPPNVLINPLLANIFTLATFTGAMTHTTPLSASLQLIATVTADSSNFGPTPKPLAAACVINPLFTPQPVVPLASAITAVASVPYALLGAPDPYWQDTMLAMTGRPTNGSGMTDYGRYGYSLPSGNGGGKSKFGGDSIGGSVQAGTVANGFDFGTGDFTIEMWYNPISVYSVQKNSEYTPSVRVFRQAIASLDGSKGSAGGQSTWELYHSLDGFMQAGWSQYAGSPFIGLVTSTTPIPFNTWTHVAWVKQGLQSRLYINGVLESSATAPAHIFTNIADRFYSTARFGAEPDANDFVDDVWVYRFAKYTSNFTPDTQGRGRGYGITTHALSASASVASTLTPGQTDTMADNYFANVALLLNGDAGFVDVSSKNRQLLLTGAPQVSGNSKYGTSSLYFPAIGDYLRFPNTSDMAFGTGEFTVECWFNWTADAANPSGLGQLLQIGDGSSNPCVVLAFYNDLKRIFCIVGGVSNAPSTVITEAVWHHLAVTRSGTVVRIFLDGTQIGTITLSAGYSFTLVGTYSYVGTSPWYDPSVLYTLHGYVDDLRITKGIARYGANFVPPTAPFDTVDYKGMVPVRNYVSATTSAEPSVLCAMLSTSATVQELHTRALALATMSPGMRSGPSVAANAVAFPNVRWAYLGNSDGTAQKNLAAAAVAVASVPTKAIIKDPRLAASGIDTDFDGIPDQSAVATLTATLTVAPQYDPFYDQVLLLLHGDGANGGTTFTDNSPNAWTPTVVGAVTTSTAQSVFGGSSMLFDGTTGYLQMPSNAAFDISNSDVTIEMFVNWTAAPTQSPFISLELVGGVDRLLQMYRAIDAQAGTVLVALGYNSSANASCYVPLSIASNTWVHLCLMREGNILSVWINGVRKHAQYWPTATSNYTTHVLKVGGGDTSYSDFHAGYIDEVRVTKAARRATYGPSFEVPTYPYPSKKWVWRFATPTGTGCVASVIADLSAVEGANFKRLASAIVINPVVSAAIGLNVRVASSLVVSATFTADASSSVPLAASGLSVFSATADLTAVGGGGTVQLAANAVMLATVTADLLRQNTKNLAADLVGTPAATAPLRVAKTLQGAGATATQSVSATILARAEDPYFSYVSWLILFRDGAGSTAFTDSSPRPKTSTVIRATETASNGLSWSTAGMMSDGTSGGQGPSTYKSFYAALPARGNADREDFEFGTGDFTIEYWKKTTSTFNIRSMDLSIDNLMTMLWISNTNEWYVETYPQSAGSGIVFQTINCPFPAGEWNHVALVRESDVLSLFLNGTRVGFMAYPYDLSSTASTGAIRVYYGESQDWTLTGFGIGYGDGYISSVRITKGIARYTGNFTVQPADFGIVQAAAPAPLVKLSTKSGDPYFQNAFAILRGDNNDGGSIVNELGQRWVDITPNFHLHTGSVAAGIGKFGNGAMYGRFELIPSTTGFPLLELGTFECWVNCAEMIDGDSRSVFQYSNVTLDVTQSSWWILDATVVRNSGVVTMSFGQGGPGYGSAQVAPSVTVPSSGWFHFAMTFQGTGYWASGAGIRFFINGVNVTSGGCDTIASPAFFYIGTTTDFGLTRHLLLDEIRFTRNIVRYTTAGFTPETRPYTDLKETPPNPNVATFQATILVVRLLASDQQSSQVAVAVLALSVPLSSQVLTRSVLVAHLAINGAGALKDLGNSATAVAAASGAVVVGVTLSATAVAMAVASGVLAKWLSASASATPSATARMVSGAGAVLDAVMTVAPSLQPLIAYAQDTSDAYLSSVVLLLHGGGTNGSYVLGDSSPNPKAILSGSGFGYNVSATKSRYGGTSLYNTGTPTDTAPREIVNVGSDFDFGADDFTIDFWINPISSSSGFFGGILGRWGVPTVFPRIPRNGDAQDFFLGVDGYLKTGYVNIVFLCNSLTLDYSYYGGRWIPGTVGPSVPLNVWSHVAVQRGFGYLTIYVNGIVAARAKATGTIAYTPTQSSFLFPNYGAGVSNSYWNGYLDELRVTKGVARYGFDGFWLSSTAYYSPQRIAVAPAVVPAVVAELIIDPFVPRLTASPAVTASVTAALQIGITGAQSASIYAVATLTPTLPVGKLLGASMASVAKGRMHIMGVFVDMAADAAVQSSVTALAGFAQPLASAIQINPVANFSFPGPKPLAAAATVSNLVVANLGSVADPNKALAAAVTCRARMTPGIQIPDRFPKLNNASYETNMMLSAPAIYVRLNDTTYTGFTENKIGSVQSLFYGNGYARYDSGGPANGGYATFDATNPTPPYVDTQILLNVGGEFTISVWVKPADTQPDGDINSIGAHIFGCRQVYQTSYNNAPVALVLYEDYIPAVLIADPVNGYYRAMDFPVIPSNVWTHLAVTFSATNNSVKLFVNGNTNTEYGVVVTPPTTSTITWTIGGPTPRLNGGAITTFNGAISEAAVHTRALSEFEVLRLYESALAYQGGAIATIAADLVNVDGPGRVSFACAAKAVATLGAVSVARTVEMSNTVGDTYWDRVVLMLPFEEFSGSYPLDSSINTKYVSDYYGVKDPSYYKFGLASMRHDTATYIQLRVNNNPDFNFASGDFCIDLWTHVQSTGSLGGVLFGRLFSPTVSCDYAILVSPSRQLSVNVNNVQLIAPSTSTQLLDRWCHVALARYGNQFTLYLDGQPVGSATSSATINSTSLPELHMGSWGSELNSWLVAWFDEVRVTKGAARYYGAFAPEKSESQRAMVLQCKSQATVTADLFVPERHQLACLAFARARLDQPFQMSKVLSASMQLVNGTAFYLRDYYGLQAALSASASLALSTITHPTTLSANIGTLNFFPDLTITVRKNLAASAVASASVTADVFKWFMWQPAFTAQASATADFTMTKPLSATAGAQSLLAIGIWYENYLSISMAASATMTAGAVRKVMMSAAISSVATKASSLVTTKPLSVSAQSVATINAALDPKVVTLAATPQAQATSSGTVYAGIFGAVQSIANASVTASLKQAITLSAAAQAQPLAQFALRTPVASDSSTNCTLQASLAIGKAMAAAAVTTETVSSTLGLAKNLSGVLVSVAGVAPAPVYNLGFSASATAVATSQSDAYVKLLARVFTRGQISHVMEDNAAVGSNQTSSIYVVQKP